ncbi:MAG: type II toxin-antitoxin system RelE/ParE family toxin [Planctomycetia bacterium]|nr:type II toxin-antitoxin system RelE/ParE family toxin [Planctomycetia bacterium]
MIRVHPAATSEAVEAAAWYFRRSERRGIQFSDRLREAYAEVEAHPLRWAAYRKRTRHFKLRGFPYLVVYRPWQEGVFVLAVAHGKRKPAYWAKRLRDIR